MILLSKYDFFFVLCPFVVDNLFQAEWAWLNETDCNWFMTYFEHVCLWGHL